MSRGASIPHRRMNAGEQVQKISSPFFFSQVFSNPKEQFLTMQGMVIGLDITPKFSYVTLAFTHDLLDLFAFRA